MRKEEREFLVSYIESMRDSYIGGEAPATYPFAEYDALDAAIKAIRKLEKIEGIIKIHDYDNMVGYSFCVDRIRRVLGEE
jgi:hypothetical protein